jgi:hypothetical protein
MTDLRTAAQQALEFVTGEQWGTIPYMDSRVYEDAARLHDALRAALEQPEQPEQAEPVAWMVYTLDGKSVCVTDNPADFTDEHRVLPLYAHPPRGLTEPVAVAWRTFDGEGGYDYRTYDDNENYRNEWDKRNPNHKGWVDPLYAAPPRREWKSLSEGEIIDAVRESDLDWQRGWTLEDSEPNRYTQLARAIEAKLRELNHD